MGFGQIEAFAHDGVDLAFERQAGAAATFVWLGGCKSDMAGLSRPEDLELLAQTAEGLARQLAR